VVAKGGENPPFYLKDNTGVIRVVPEGAAIHGVPTFDRNCGQTDPLYFAKGPLSAAANSTRLEVIPNRCIGRMARLFRQNLLKAADLERAPIEVRLES